MRNANCLVLWLYMMHDIMTFSKSLRFQKSPLWGKFLKTCVFDTRKRRFRVDERLKRGRISVFKNIWWTGTKSNNWEFFLDSVSYVGGVAFGKDIGPERTPLSTSSRTVAYVFSCLALIIINTYCANLTAFLLVETDHFPITGVNDPKVGSIG